jgi:hypothetical protein
LSRGLRWNRSEREAMLKMLSWEDEEIIERCGIGPL